MSHIGVRQVANWYRDNTYGINAIAADAAMRDAGDAAPPTITVYDETHSAWLARRRLPDANDATASISYPMVIVVLGRAQFAGGRSLVTSGGRYLKGLITVVTQLFLHANPTDVEIVNAMYVARAIRGSLAWFEEQTETVRTLTGCRLEESQSIDQAQPKPELGDLTLVTSIATQYPVLETSPVTSS